MGFFDDVFGGGAGKKAARQNQSLLSGLKTEGMGYIDQSQQASQGYLEQAGGLYSGLADASLENLDYYSDALGLNGSEGSTAALDRFQTGPGYEFQMTQGLDALARTAAARGQLNSGNTNIDTLSYASGLANQEWDDYLGNLQAYDSQQNSNYLTGLGGQAGSLGSLADLSQSTADKKLNLSSEVVNGQMGANNAYATAKNQGIGNIGSLISGGVKLLSGYL